MDILVQIVLYWWYMSVTFLEIYINEGITIQIDGSYVEDDVSEDGKTFYLILNVVEDTWENYIHPLDVSYFRILNSIAHKYIFSPLLKYDILEGKALALSSINIFYYLLIVLLILLLHFRILW